MDKQKNKRASYLTVLMCYTLLAFAAGAEILITGNNNGMLVQLIAKLGICWLLHIIRKVPAAVEKWAGYVLLMHGVVIFGLRPTSLFSLHTVIIGLIALYFAAEMYELINLTVIAYFATMIANIVFVSWNTLKVTPTIVVTLISQSAFVLLSAYVAKLIRERRRDAARAVDERIDKLEEESHRTEDFLTNVSHELRTPINAVTGLTAVMLKNEEDAGKRENLYSIQKAGYRLFGQIEDILDYTEIDTGKIVANEDSYMLSSLVNDIITERSMTDTKEGIELIFDVEAKIPAMLIGDSRKIKKIIKHLVDNAVKFTEKGGVYVRIYALRKSYGLNLCIQVQDTGIGMDAESLAKITERFYQSSRGRDRRAGGLGLGLPIVYGMTAVMEGFIQIESSVGNGTTVMVSIPQKIADESAGMKVENPSELCLACYLMPEKYEVAEVRKFYDRMISNIACGLDVTVHRVFSIDELEKLVSMYRLTHLFLAQQEYEASSEFVENLDSEIQVVVVADKNYKAKANSRVKILRKPFYCFPVVNILNADSSQASPHGKQMVCPDVKVLVIDDEPMNRMVAEGILKDYRMTVRTASSGMEAVAMCEEEEFDIWFIDHMMPEMDGVETLKQLRRLHTDSANMSAAIAFTANAVSGAREMFLREGFDDFLSKPVDAHELDRVLRKVLPKSRIQFVDIKDTANSESSESKPDSPAKKDEITLLREAGINTAAALDYCRKDPQFYIQLLRKFVTDADGKAKDINKSYENEDYANYRIMVHALKSSAKMMGADSLSQSAKDMEEAAKESNAEYVKANHDKLMDEYAQTVKLISSSIGVVTEESGEDEAPEGTSITLDELHGYLEELRGCFETYEADKAQNLIDELGKTVYDGKAVKSMLRDIKHDVEEFEYEAAAEKTLALEEQLKGGGK